MKKSKSLKTEWSTSFNSIVKMWEIFVIQLIGEGDIMKWKNMIKMNC